MQALVISVGGTAEPIVKSILEHRPKFICYVCSQQSVEQLGKIRDELKARNPELEYKDYKIIVDDADDLTHCYAKAMACRSRLEEWGVAPEETVVDYTGGTKNMSVALAMATMRYGYSFSYVGGTQRTKGGLGIVESGTERVRTVASPWTLFALEERNRIAEYFNNYQFIAAQKAIGGLLKSRAVESTVAQFLVIVDHLCDGYILWEQFRLKEAAEKLEGSLNELNTFVEYGRHEKYRPFLFAVIRNMEWLNKVRSETRGQNHLHMILVCDLMSNASRRAEEGKYDDAVARLYRALEMVAQIAAQNHLKIEDAGRVREEVVPLSIRERFVRKYKDDSTKLLKLPSRALFELLSQCGVKEGIKYIEHEEDFKGILSARNQSILAHGQTPVRADTYQKFYDLVCDSFGISEHVDFPKIELD